MYERQNFPGNKNWKDAYPPGDAQETREGKVRRWQFSHSLLTQFLSNSFILSFQMRSQANSHNGLEISLYAWSSFCRIFNPPLAPQLALTNTISEEDGSQAKLITFS